MAQGSDQFASLTADTTLQGRQLENGSQYWQIDSTGSLVGASGGGAVRAAKNSAINMGMLTTSTSGTTGGTDSYTNVSDCNKHVLVSANARFVGTLGEVRAISLESRANKFADAYEHRIVYVDGSTAYWNLRKIVGGAATSLGTSNKTFVSGTWYSLAGFTSDAVKAVYGDGAVVITSSDNAITAYSGSGFYLYQEGSGIGSTKTCELDDFIVSPPPKSVSAGARQAVTRAATR